jgi:hypothetical protein
VLLRLSYLLVVGIGDAKASASSVVAEGVGSNCPSSIRIASTVAVIPLLQEAIRAVAGHPGTQSNNPSATVAGALTRPLAARRSSTGTLPVALGCVQRVPQSAWSIRSMVRSLVGAVTPGLGFIESVLIDTTTLREPFAVTPLRVMNP